jgi:hypothetical protein
MKDTGEIKHWRRWSATTVSDLQIYGGWLIHTVSLSSMLHDFIDTRFAVTVPYVSSTMGCSYLLLYMYLLVTLTTPRLRFFAKSVRIATRKPSLSLMSTTALETSGDVSRRQQAQKLGKRQA